MNPHTENHVNAAMAAGMQQVPRVLMEINPDPILVRDRKGTVLFANPAFAEVFDLNPGAIQGASGRDVLPGELLDALDEVERNASSNNAVVEHRFSTRGEKQRSFLIRHVAVGIGKPAQLIACTLFRDITDNAESIRQMAATRDEAEAANLIKSRFLANMSHELRTPLNSIIGYSELLLDDEALDPVQVEDLARIKRAGAELLCLVDEVLDFSRLQSNQTDVHYDTVHTAPFISRLVLEIEPIAAREGNRLLVDLDQAPATVSTDVNKLEKILTALLNNACKFTHDGEIALSVNEVIESRRRWITFEVTDSGIGIPPSELPKIFDPFYQVDDSPTRTYGGTGLGLHVSQQFSKLLGGDIRVVSEPDKGSVFTFWLPVTRKQVAQGTGQETRQWNPDRAIGTDGPMVLVIEDNQEASDLISRHLTRHGCRVTCAADGITGKKTAEDLQPELITLALKMQRIDGWSLLQHVKADHRTRNIPIVICSNIDERKRGFEFGVAGYLLKPVTGTAVRDMLKKIPEFKERLRL